MGVDLVEVEIDLVRGHPEEVGHDHVIATIH